MVLKGLAMGYGLACIGLAFLADLLGTGVLQVKNQLTVNDKKQWSSTNLFARLSLFQASLTIFGVVGGPLLGLFTLGRPSNFL